MLHETLHKNGYTVNIYRDEDPSNPRRDSRRGVMVCFHKGYTLGDDHQFQNPAGFEEWRKRHAKSIAAILPLYLYDHSGITISTSSFNDRWDSGQIGYIYITKAVARKQLALAPGPFDKNPIVNVRDCETALRAEVGVYDQYLTGDVYGYVIVDAAGDDVDSCWDFYGLEHCKAEALARVPDEQLSETAFESYIEGLPA